jgi:DNA-binding NtrC family response regulator
VKKGGRTLLVVDDDALFGRAARDFLQDLGLEILLAGTLREALARARERSIDVVLLDQQLPDGYGAEACGPLLAANDQCKIIFVTAFPAFENVLAALRGGAFDYIPKPCEPEVLRLAVERSLKTLSLERTRTVHERTRAKSAESSLLYFGPALEEVRRLAELAARVDSPVLLLGETGTGKSMVARAIHYQGARRDGEFVSVNCAALPEAMIEAELFGHERGAFTGAAGSRAGLFEMADGGTILLDEIAELPYSQQARLLHVLEDHTVRRIGGQSMRRVDFRLVTATNVEIEEAVASRRFREDLFHRLNVLPIRLPPLREHPEDIPALAERLLGELGVGRNERWLADGELERLSCYRWPGNIRELRNVLERALLVSNGPALAPSAFLAPPAPSALAPPAGSTRPEPGSLETLAEHERRHIQETLEHCRGNLSKAARELGVSRSTLRRKLREPGS